MLRVNSAEGNAKNAKVKFDKKKHGRGLCELSVLGAINFLGSSGFAVARQTMEVTVAHW
jgi:hypothetical protein